MAWHVNQHLAHALPASLENQKITLIGTITSVVEVNENQNIRFKFNVSMVSNKSCDWQLPANIRLSWDKPAHKLLPGDRWSLQVKLKRPRNYANPGSFDTEKNYFQQRIVASGYVVTTAKQNFIDHSKCSAVINYLRQSLLEQLLLNLNKLDFSGIIIALILGVKHNIEFYQQELFQVTGVAHLMSISGLHMGMICSMVFISMRLLWRIVPRYLLNISALQLAAWCSLAVSIIYALLAGFSIATQRALIMISVFVFGLIAKRKTCSVHNYNLALLIVLLHDPFAVLSIGFWLSFGAVGLLIYALRGRITKWWQQQWVITIGLFPLTLLCFAQYSIISPIANLIAIPWVSLTVLPFGLLGTIFVPINTNISALFLGLAAKSFALLWLILKQLAQVPVYNWAMSKTNLFLTMIPALIAVLWLFLPRGLPGRHWGVVGLLPLVFGVTQETPYGLAQFTLLDVGQGLAAVIKTKNHTLVYDTGAKLNEHFDLGSRVVAPFLQSIGVKKINTLIISHADNDHIGGAVSLMKKIKTSSIITTATQELAVFNPYLCEAGQQWNWDGVIFTVLHPNTNSYYSKRNNNSCVLMVQAGLHKVLLTGDIEALSERLLIMRYGNQLQADVMLVPHHGSKTSSSQEFLEQVRPNYALIPVGHKNQYGHPKAEVLERYKKLGISALRTDFNGAIGFKIGGYAIQPSCYRHEQRHFWSAEAISYCY
jgi:competence protein ComEC